MKRFLRKFDRSTTQWVIRVFGASSRPFFAIMTRFGDPIPITIITIGVIGSGIYFSTPSLIINGAMIPVTVLIGLLLKVGFERARPLTEYAMSMRFQTFSFPSGHSSGSMVAYGLLAYLALIHLPSPGHVVICSILAIIPIFVGLSRVYLGAHFPSDVIAGWLLGLVMLTLMVVVTLLA